MLDYIILAFSIIGIVSIFQPIKKIEKFLVFLFVVSMMFFAGLRGGGTDYVIYELLYKNFASISIEPTFKLISYLVTVFSNNIQFLFLIFAFLGVGLKLRGIYILSNFILLSLCIYFSNFFLLHEMIQIRAGVASAFLLLAIKPIYDRNLKLFLIFSTAGFLFHYSALMIYPLWFISQKINFKILFISVFLGYAIFFLGLNFVQVIPIPGIREKIEIYLALQKLEDKQINVFNYLYLFRLMIFYVLLIFYQKIEEHNKYFPILLNIYCLSMVSYTVFAQIPAFATRISEFLGVVEIILIPLIMCLFKPSIFGRLIVVLLAVVFLLVNLFYVKLIL